MTPMVYSREEVTDSARCQQTTDGSRQTVLVDEVVQPSQCQFWKHDVQPEHCFDSEQEPRQYVPQRSACLVHSVPRSTLPAYIGQPEGCGVGGLDERKR